MSGELSTKTATTQMMPDQQLLDSSSRPRLDDVDREQVLPTEKKQSLPTLSSVLWRAFEVSVASAVLILSSPIMLVVAIIIRIDSKGPAIFHHKRVGKDGRLFTFYKFRTLRADARQVFPELYAYEYSSAEIENLQFKSENDPRVTRVGRWLRRITVDELPNFCNILTGDVTLVGPRAELPEMVRYHAPEHMVKFTVKPGITGLAQISGRGRLKFNETNAYDAEYVRTRTFWLDCKILFLTLKKVCRFDGAF
jgi:lipopolysaccharide/colanic/teichoic acid biosynthesis glycosyltransferase